MNTETRVASLIMKRILKSIEKEQEQERYYQNIEEKKRQKIQDHNARMRKWELREQQEQRQRHHEKYLNDMALIEVIKEYKANHDHLPKQLRQKALHDLGLSMDCWGNVQTIYV